MIPKRIIHIYSPPAGRSPELPLVARAAVNTARLLHPDFEWVLFDTQRMRSFLREHAPEYEQVIEQFPFPIQRFDFFRYIAVYKLGGFYLDLDLFLAKSLEPLLEESCVFSFEELSISGFLRDHHGMDWELANYAFGAEPGHPFIKAIIDNCVRGLRQPQWAARMLEGIPRPFRPQFVVPSMTGPGVVSRTLAENPDISPQVSLLFPADICDEENSQKFGDFGVHLIQGSWRKKQSFLRSRLARLWENRRRRQWLLRSRALGPTRKGPWKTFQPTQTLAV